MLSFRSSTKLPAQAPSADAEPTKCCHILLLGSIIVNPNRWILPCFLDGKFYFHVSRQNQNQHLGLTLGRYQYGPVVDHLESLSRLIFRYSYFGEEASSCLCWRAELHTHPLNRGSMGHSFFKSSTQPLFQSNNDDFAPDLDERFVDLLSWSLEISQ